MALAPQCPVPDWHTPAAAAAADGTACGGAGVGADVGLADSVAADMAAASSAGSGISGTARERAPSAAVQPTCPPETPWRMAALAAARPPQGGAQLSQAQPVCQAAGYWRAPTRLPACRATSRLLLAAGAAEAAGGTGPMAQPQSDSQGPAAPARKPRRVLYSVRAASAAVLQLLMVGLGLAGWVARRCLAAAGHAGSAPSGCYFLAHTTAPATRKRGRQRRQQPEAPPARRGAASQGTRVFALTQPQKARTMQSLECAFVTHCFTSCVRCNKLSTGRT